jgi:TfoX/Sxy family transcriptional regulator of competence genes
MSPTVAPTDRGPAPPRLYSAGVAYSEQLARRIRDVIGARDAVTERKMFGGVAWMVDGNMACGTMGDDLLVRLDREDADRILAEPHVRLMRMGGRTMRGFFAVGAAAIADDAELVRWIDAGAAYAASLPPK